MIYSIKVVYPQLKYSNKHVDKIGPINSPKLINIIKHPDDKSVILSLLTSFLIFKPTYIIWLIVG